MSVLAIYRLMSAGAAFPLALILALIGVPLALCVVIAIVAYLATYYMLIVICAGNQNHNIE